MGYAELLDFHVMPIARARRLPEGGFSRPTWVGTGFTFGEGTLVSCWHCVGADLAEDEVYFAAGRRQGNKQQERDWPIELRDASQDVNSRTDLALARIDPWCQPRLTLADEPLEWGDDVVVLGFPHTLDTINPETKEKRIETHGRVLKSYVTRLFRDDLQHDVVVEFDAPAPVGFSGSPLFNAQRSLVRGGLSLEPFECHGVVFREQTIETPDGVFRHGTALHLHTLRNAAGPATDGRPLAEYLARPEAVANDLEDGAPE